MCKISSVFQYVFRQNYHKTLKITYAVFHALKKSKETNAFRKIYSCIHEQGRPETFIYLRLPEAQLESGTNSNKCKGRQGKPPPFHLLLHRIFLLKNQVSKQKANYGARKRNRGNCTQASFRFKSVLEKASNLPSFRFVARAKTSCHSQPSLFHSVSFTVEEGGPEHGLLHCGSLGRIPRVSRIRCKEGRESTAHKESQRSSMFLLVLIFS